MTVDKENRLMLRIAELEAQVRQLEQRAAGAPSCPVCGSSRPLAAVPVGNHPAGRAKRDE